MTGRRGREGQQGQRGQSRQPQGHGQPQQPGPGAGQGAPSQGGQAGPPGRSNGSAGTRPDRYLPGVVAGVGAFLAGYALVYLLKGSEWMQGFQSQLGRGAQLGGGSFSMLKQMGLSLPAQWKVVGMGYHGVHYVDLSVSVSTGSRQFSQTTPGLYYSTDIIAWLVPIVLLAGAGFVIVSREGISSLGTGATTGATVVAGYLPLVLLTSMLFRWSDSLTNTAAGQTVTVSMSMGPALVSTAVFAGIVYPLVCGGLGGVVASTLSSPSQPSRPAGRRR